MRKILFGLLSLVLFSCNTTKTVTGLNVDAPTPFWKTTELIHIEGNNWQSPQEPFERWKVVPITHVLCWYVGGDNEVHYTVVPSESGRKYNVNDSIKTTDGMPQLYVAYVGNYIFNLWGLPSFPTTKTEYESEFERSKN